MENTPVDSSSPDFFNGHKLLTLSRDGNSGQCGFEQMISKRSRSVTTGHSMTKKLEVYALTWLAVQLSLHLLEKKKVNTRRSEQEHCVELF